MIAPRPPSTIVGDEELARAWVKIICSVVQVSTFSLPVKVRVGSVKKVLVPRFVLCPNPL